MQAHTEPECCFQEEVPGPCRALPLTRVPCGVQEGPMKGQFGAAVPPHLVRGVMGGCLGNPCPEPDFQLHPLPEALAHSSIPSTSCQSK